MIKLGVLMLGCISLYLPAEIHLLYPILSLFLLKQTDRGMLSENESGKVGFMLKRTLLLTKYAFGV